mmetsp:Transcript_24355/g.37523  ORF Transcript_24355/g.37523 Transcript_24355/m.37523 type:complete len:323 (-) Transcript_24355:156-1124(-)|eukprot:CAMPEP_0195300538 /NCGR_PEP_ID=MMETSP0707-20130614/27635_1 /TAXON_ID=33640 /ORGANISM="Asterionellopsis glacialis, Strain CCMP134" /LENGTH=322 /DNA_ID=CAMNT_0040363259 /DNA_START=57 /DNA_END=1025 /DNA_ORIENTATION=+
MAGSKGQELGPPSTEHVGENQSKQTTITENHSDTIFSAAGTRRIGDGAKKGSSTKNVAKKPKKRGAPKKDPWAPKRPLSSFFAYSNSKKASLKRKNPNLTNVDLSRMLAKKWREAPQKEKQHYLDQEQQELIKYKAKMAEYKKAQSAEAKRRQDSERESEQEQNENLQESSAVPPTQTQLQVANLGGIVVNPDPTSAILGQAFLNPQVNILNPNVILSQQHQQPQADVAAAAVLSTALGGQIAPMALPSTFPYLTQIQVAVPDPRLMVCNIPFTATNPMLGSVLNQVHAPVGAQPVPQQGGQDPNIGGAAVGSGNQPDCALS